MTPKPNTRYKNIYPQWTGAKWSFVAQVRHKGQYYCLGSFPATEAGERDALDKVVQFKADLPAIDCIRALRCGKVSEGKRVELLAALKR